MYEGINCFESRVRGISLYNVWGKHTLSNHFSSRPSKRMTDICNIKYIITAEDLSPNDFTKCLAVYNSVDPGKIYLYSNNFSFPRAFLVENIDQNVVNEVLLNNYTAPLLQLEISDEAWNILSNHKDIDIRWSPNTYTISAECKSRGFLFLSEMNEAGWIAKLDGLPVQLFSPFNFFMGVFLPPGKHLVTFQFRPLYFYIFSAISIGTFLISMFMIMYFGIIKIRFRVDNNRRQVAKRDLR